MKKLRVLVACEYSGRVRDAFTAKGHKAMSCDLLPSETDGPHYQGDLSHLLLDDWDMIIAFPPCTHLASSGARWFKEKIADGRQQEGIDFFMKFANHPYCPRICIENPVGIMSTKWRKPDQIIQPYEYGDPFMKTTCLWLKGLPLLEPTNILPEGQREQACWLLGPSPDRAKLRSKTYQGIAEAMASQWGTL